MRCPKCKHENREGAKFCEKCGTELQLVCPRCGKELRETASFCDGCGTKIEVSASETATPEPEDIYAQLRSLIPDMLAQRSVAPEQQYTDENRFITVLFVDISGFTALSATRSSEAMLQLMRSFFKPIVSIINRYEGEISGFRGDGLLALFGTPVLHENDAQRAIMVALEIRNAMRDQLKLEIRIGINTAYMTVGEVRTQLHSEYGAYGIDINLASRLQESAEPGQILVSAGTHRLTRHAFDFETTPPLHLRGFPEPVPAYVVKRVKIHPEKLRGIEGLFAGMVGREREFAQLKEATGKWLQGQGQIVSIIGEAGIGKSRLVTELKKYLTSRKDNTGNGLSSQLLYLEGCCASVGPPVSYGPFLELLRTYFNLSEEDDATTIASKVINITTLLFGDGAEELLPFLGRLLSIRFGNDLDDRLKLATAEQIKHQTLIRLLDFFKALAKNQPLLLILEDLHWADDLSLDLISLLMNELATISLMLLCVYRPEQENRAYQLGSLAQRKCLESYTEIVLRPLPSKERLQLLDTLLTIDDLPEDVKNVILGKSEGNPFFIEEMIRSLIDQDLVYRDGEHWKARKEISSIDIPDTIQVVVMARVDRLKSKRARYILQCASVIGPVFKYRLLEHLTQYERDLDLYLSELEERNLVNEEHTVPELEYAFRHTLIHEATYQSISETQRKEFHYQIAGAIEMLYRERLKEYYEELARHYSMSDDTDKAVEYLFKAGEKAKGMYANDVAIRYFERTLEFIQEQPEDKKQTLQEANIRESLGEVLFTTGSHSEAEVQLNHALRLASKQEDPQHLAALTCKLADMIHWQADYQRAIEVAESGLTALGGQNCPEAADLLEVITRSYWAKYDWESARRYANQSAQIIRQIPYFDSIYKTYYSLFYVEMCLGNLQSALNWLEEMEQVCLAHNNEIGLARCYHGLGDLWRAKEDYQQASQWFEKSLRYCERTGEAHWLLEGHLELAHILLRLDANPSQIEDHVQRGIEIADRMASTSHVASAPILCKMLGEAYLEKGDIKQAMFCFRRAIEFGPGNALDLCLLLCDLEKLYIQQGQHEAFFDFCQQTQQQTTIQPQTTLCYWHLQPGIPSTDYSRLVVRDSFESPSLCEGWCWINPQGESSYDFLQGGILEMRTPARHDLSFPKLNAPRLLRQISGDFAVETRLVNISEEECQIGGLLLWISERMYLSFRKRLSCIEVCLEVYQEGHQKIIGRGWLPGHELHLRLERREKSVSALCSNDDKQWQSCGETSLPVDDPVWVGLFVICPTDLPGSVMHFQGFRLFQREKI